MAVPEVVAVIVVEVVVVDTFASAFPQASAAVGLVAQLRLVRYQQVVWASVPLRLLRRSHP